MLQEFDYFIVYNHFLISQGSAETLFRGGGKINHLSIALTLSNTCAKNY